MKKKIIIITISIFLILLIVFSFYIIKQLNKNLTWQKKYSYENVEIIETITANFKKTKVDKITGEFQMTFKDQVEANAYYSTYKNKRKLLIKGNKITYYTDETKTFQKINRNRYQLKENLEAKELGYTCN